MYPKFGLAKCSELTKSAQNSVSRIVDSTIWVHSCVALYVAVVFVHFYARLHWFPWVGGGNVRWTSSLGLPWARHRLWALTRYTDELRTFLWYFWKARVLNIRLISFSTSKDEYHRRTTNFATLSLAKLTAEQKYFLTKKCIPKFWSHRYKDVYISLS